MIVIRRGFFNPYLKYFCSTNLEQQSQTQRITNPETALAKIILNPVQIPKQISIQNLASLLNVSDKDLIRTFKLISNSNVNYAALTQDQIDPILGLYDSYLNNEVPIPRPPIVTIMGHVDHGKTTLLDTLRHSSIALGEVGGITQKIGAFHYQTPNGMITFIDTPGHEAFANMRQRGALFTDLIILVVSAADGVQQQTKEVIQLAHSLQIPMIVAVNKIDLIGSNPEEIEGELVDQGLELETVGGNIPVVHISAKTGKNLDLLIELIQFQSELLNLSADPNIRAQGFVLEARQQDLEAERGSTLIVQKGTLRIGDILVVGNQYGKVKGIRDDRGNVLQEALPSFAVEIIGLKELPQSGEKFFVTTELMAKLIVQNRQNTQESQDIQTSNNISGDQGKIKFENYRERKSVYGDPSLLRGKYQEIQDMILSEIQQTEDPETLLALTNQLEQHKNFSNEMISEKKDNGLNLIIKGSDYGTLETLKQMTEKVIKQNAGKVNIISSGVGDINLKDIKEAQLFEATILSLNVKVPQELIKIAHCAKIQILQHQIIYHLIDDFKKLISNPLKAQKVTVLGSGKVMNVFDLKLGKGLQRRVFGLTIAKGMVQKKNYVRVSRGGQIIFNDLEIVNLKHFKQEVLQVECGKDCGIAIAANVDIKIGDEFEFYKN